MYPDLRYYYGVDLVDVIEGRGPAPSLVLALIGRLPDTSLTIALAAGGREHFGWGIDRHMAADAYDATRDNTLATGNWAKGKQPKFPLWPRPKTKPSKTTSDAKPRTSVKDIYKKFQKR